MYKTLHVVMHLSTTSRPSRALHLALRLFDKDLASTFTFSFCDDVPPLLPRHQSQIHENLDNSCVLVRVSFHVRHWARLCAKHSQYTCTSLIAPVLTVPQRQTIDGLEYSGYLPFSDPYDVPVPARIVRHIPSDSPSEWQPASSV
jgi:hypothetical protein